MKRTIHQRKTCSVNVHFTPEDYGIIYKESIHKAIPMSAFMHKLFLNWKESHRISNREKY